MNACRVGRHTFVSPSTQAGLLPSDVSVPYDCCLLLASYVVSTSHAQPVGPNHDGVERPVTLLLGAVHGCTLTLTHTLCVAWKLKRMHALCSAYVHAGRPPAGLPAAAGVARTLTELAGLWRRSGTA